MFRINTPRAATAGDAVGQSVRTSNGGASGKRGRIDDDDDFDMMVDEDDEDEAYDDGAGAAGHRAASAGGRIAMPGQAIADKDKWMRGHGTYVHGDRVVASVAGTVERVNKLVSVRPLRTRYRPEVGDLVIGRIVEVGPKRWKVEAHATQNAVLMLSSINLPGGVQRRKLESDELQMRTFFQEGDLLVAEVQAFFADGAMSLHTRSLKYGKLKNGALVIVAPSLITRLKSHFHSLPYGVDLIIGLNGYIWVSKTVNRARGIADGTSAAMDDAGFGEESGEYVYSSENEDISPKLRRAIARTGGVISLLARHCVPISADVIAQAYDVSLELYPDEDGQGIDGGEDDEIMLEDRDGARRGGPARRQGLADMLGGAGSVRIINELARRKQEDDLLA